MIVATAGHIDHGKTLLVRTLTGVDTDRLPEEKARGISIDLGFAYWPLDSGAVIGFVDVPGHERFIRNMLAGVCGIDFALLVVAADDGVMPQTIEHLQILDLLGCRYWTCWVSSADSRPSPRPTASRPSRWKPSKPKLRPCWRPPGLRAFPSCPFQRSPGLESTC
jgi:selenocysteine-specific elongation factor